MKLRKAELNDLPLMVDLCVAVVKDNRLPFRNGGTHCVNECSKLFLRNPDGVLMVAEEDGKIWGWCGAVVVYPTFSDEPIAQVRAWNTHPKLRGKGIGGQLMILTKQYIYDNYPDVRLFTVGFNIDSSTQPEIAEHKIEAMGFKEFERAYYIKIRD